MRREVIILGVIAAVLLALAPLLVLSQRGMSRRVFCERRQTYVFDAMVRHHEVKNHLPGWKQLQAETVDGTVKDTGWVFPLLPYIGYDPEKLEGPPPPPGFPQLGSLEHIHRDYGQEGETRRGEMPHIKIPLLMCPAEDPELTKLGPSFCSFIVNGGMPDVASQSPPDLQANGMIFNRMQPQFTAGFQPELDYVAAADGASTTLLISENVDAGFWPVGEEALNCFVFSPTGKPPVLHINEQTGQAGDEADYQFARPSSFHVGGVNAVFCAGNTKFVSAQIAPCVYWQLISPDDLKAATPGGEAAF